MPARSDIHRIVIIGSGPIVIGQACEFDYSGNQAVRALKEDGYEVIVCNPNPASYMIAPGLADRIYMEPLEPAHMEAIIQAEKPDALLATMGGQTALNLARELYHRGILRKHGVELIGAGMEAIELAEDRGKFKEKMTEIGLDSPGSGLVTGVAEGRRFLERYGLPLIIRPSFTLGGKGGGIAYREEEFETKLQRALDLSPVHTALVEESLIGWKEFELEVVRDAHDNATIVCSIENIDPMGVHTGDSMTVAPTQTLSDREYQRMRAAAIQVLRAVGVDCGGSNVQFALDPESDRMVVIEMNPRVSRSSALASKATGFPIARCAARLAVGYSLDEVINDITGKTVASFEPALDYVAVKVPRFELEKFPQGHAELGTQMKSVGEALALGRTFLEALNKGIRAAELGFGGLEELSRVSDEDLRNMTRHQHPRRLFAAYTRIARSRRAAVIADLASPSAAVSSAAERATIAEMKAVVADTGYNPWFIEALREQVEIDEQLRRPDEWSDPESFDPESSDRSETAGPLERLPGPLLFRAKQAGMLDERIAELVTAGEAGLPAEVTPGAQEVVYARRLAEGIRPGYHIVDTCAGEFEAETPYFYSSYGEIDETVALGEAGVLIVGSGPNRIGQGLEFDTSCALASRAYQRVGVKTIMVNANPETVSTDFNVSDRLHLEPVTAEDVIGVMEAEGVRDIVVQLGGQTALNIAETAERYGARIVGTPVPSIHNAEDRGLFNALTERLGLRQPRNRMAATSEDVAAAARDIGFPVLLRPSYVLGGRSMGIAFSELELREFLAREAVVAPGRPVLVDEFLEDAFEYDVDALCDGRHVYIGGVMQHIESAGVHSGDSACVFPAYKVDEEATRQMITATAVVAREFGIRGFLNLQFAVKDGTVYLIEVNPRASRTVPFISRVTGVELVDAAVQLWHGIDLRAQGLINDAETAVEDVGIGKSVVGWAVKEAVFSFDRFADADPLLGPEMRSTGEGIGLGETFGEAFAKASLATGTTLPTEGRVFVSVHDADKETILPVVRDLQERGFWIAASRGTADFLFRRGIFAEVILKVHEGHPNIVDHLEAGRIGMVINTPLGRYTQRDEDTIRIEALGRGVPYTTTTSAAEAAVEGISHLLGRRTVPRRLPDTATAG